MSSKKTIIYNDQGFRIIVEIHRTFTNHRSVCNGFYNNGKPCTRTPTDMFNVNNPSSHYCTMHQAHLPQTTPTCASDHIVYKATASHYDDLIAGHCPVCQTKRTVCYTTNNPWC